MAIPLRTQRVRGIPAPRQPAVAVDWGLAYESLIGLALFIGGEPENTYEVGPAWFKSVRRKASPELRAMARAVAGTEGYGVVGLAGLARETGGRRVADLVSRLRADHTGEVKSALLHCEPQMREALLAGDEAAKREFLKRHPGHARGFLKHVLDVDSRELATSSADLVERWDREVFSEIGPPLEGELKASAQSVTRLSHQLPAERLVVKVTRGVEYRTEPWIDEVVLVPSVLNRPWVDITEHGASKYLFYPASRDAAAPDVELVEVYKALGDETRLRILRVMSTGVTSLSEIAEKLGLAKSTVHGHLVVLRIAGLTRSIVGGEGKGYELNDRPDLNSLLDSYLKS
jgi:DNA-binding transcriptional ArsR family regulator